MNQIISPAPVRKSVRVAAPQARAFDVFTQGIGRWWPKTHHIGASELDTQIIEPCQGGRWFERGVDGVECEIGHVLIWEPPARVVLAWQLGPEWKFDADLTTEVEVRFSPAGDNATVVDLEHRHLERLGDRAGAFRQQIDSSGGWGGLLALFVACADNAAAK